MSDEVKEWKIEPDNPIASRDRIIDRLTTELAASKAECENLKNLLSQEERDHETTIRQRDAHEESLNTLFNELGMTEEDAAWSSENNPVERAEEYIWRTDKQLAALRADAEANKRAMFELAKDHYWDSLEPHKEMILFHLSALAARIGEVG
jgi:chromosome segregation ATPase